MKILQITLILILFELIVVTSFSRATDYAQFNSGHQLDKVNSSKDSIVIIGASYANGWNPEEIAGCRLINKGIGGNDTQEMLARYQTDVIDNAPKAVIIWGFINDIFRSKPEELSDKIFSLKENITKMVEKSKENGITPILATEVTITTPDTWTEKLMSVIGALRGKKSYAEYINKHVIEINNWMREFAATQKLTLMDFEKVLAGEDGARKRKYAIEDGSHLTQTAYEALTMYALNIEFVP